MRSIGLIVLLIAACDHDGTGREPDEITGCGTDEHWATFSDAKAVVSDEQAPVFTSPREGATIPASMKVTLAWAQSPSSAGAADGDVPYMNGPGCNNCCPQFNTGALGTLHLPAVSGNLYDLQFTLDGKVVHRVITSLQKWGPADSLWSSWRGKTVSVAIVRMTVLHNDPREGPFTPSKPLVFTVGN